MIHILPMADLEYQQQRRGWLEPPKPEHNDRHLHPMSFRRYWNYYGRVMEWKSRHRIAWWKANFAAERFENEALRYRLPSCPNNSYERIKPLHGFQQATIDNRSEDNIDCIRSTCVLQGHCPGSNMLPKIQHCEDFDDGDDGDESLFEMEITEDMLAFLEKSDQHRRQLKAERQAASREAKKYEINKEEIGCGPPDEPPGVKRTTEMKELYGRRAATIHGMETALQLSFHRNCDYHQPKLWPNIPIKLQFK